MIKDTDFYAIKGNRENSLIEYDIHKYKDWDVYINWNSKKFGYNCLSKESLDFIKSLDIYKIIDLDGKKICLSHGSPYMDRDSVLSDSYAIFDKLIEDFNCDIYLFGHQHKSYCTYYKGKYFINPGSIGQPIGESFSYCILEFQNDTINVENINIDCDYKELENYYKNSEYYEYATEWCEVILRTMKEKKDYVINFIEALQNEAKKRNIDISQNIPNDLYLDVFKTYIQDNFK